jgi:anti-sigma factor RsiW
MGDRINQVEFAQLLSMFLDGRLNDAELARLGALILSDVALKKQYLEYCQMLALLRSEHGLLTS